MNLRDYQSQAIQKTIEAWKEDRSALIVLPTGCGKTVVFSHIVKQAAKRAMVVAHREELIRQAAQKIEAVTGEHAEIEMAGEYADKNWLYGRSKTVVSSIQTQQGRMSRFKPAEFGLLVIDEAHHATADSYRRVIEYYQQNPDLLTLGVTATPDRADEEALGQVFDVVAYNYEIVQAIRDGWLVPILSTTVEITDVDFSHIKTTAGDLNQGQLSEEMEKEKALHGVAHVIIEKCGDRRTLIFAVSIEQAAKLCALLNEHKTDCARFVHGGTPKEDRSDAVSAFAEGRYTKLVNVGVFTEGVDDPGIECVALARPTKSRALYAQMVGRGTRVHPSAGIETASGPEERRALIAASIKPAVEVIDFTANSGRHKLMTVADILGGNYTDEVVARAAAKAAANPGANVAELLDEEEEAVEREQDRKRQEQMAQRRAILGRATYKTEVVNPFDVLGLKPEREYGWDRVKKPTQRMNSFLISRGVAAQGMKFGEAKRMIAEIKSREERGLCAYSHAKRLAQFGYDTNVTPQQAAALLSNLARGQWKTAAASA